MKNKIFVFSIFSFIGIFGFSTKIFAQADVAVLMQKIQELEKKIAENIPVGTIFPFAGENVPAGYLPCDGRELNRESYRELCAVIGTRFSNGQNKCRLPDMSGRVLVGRTGSASEGILRKDENGSSLNQRVLGDIFGEELHKLGIPEMPAHNHPLTVVPHKHKTRGPVYAGGTIDGESTDGSALCGRCHMYRYTINSGGLMSDDQTVGITMNIVGEGKGFKISQPSIVVNYIIKYLGN